MGYKASVVPAAKLSKGSFTYTLRKNGILDKVIFNFAHGKVELKNAKILDFVLRAAAAIGSKNTVRDWGMTITRGKFLKGDGTPSDVSAYVPAGYIQNESGEVVKTSA